MLRHPLFTAEATTSSGGKSSPVMRPVSRGYWEMSLFWQKAQRRLHPTVAMEKALVPG